MNKDDISINMRDGISPCGFPVKEDLWSQAEEQNHSEISSSLVHQIPLRELSPRAADKRSESDGHNNNQREQDQSVRSNLYIWTCRKYDGLWTCIDLPSLKKISRTQLYFHYTANVSLSWTDIESRHAQMYSRMLKNNPRTGLSQPKRKTIRN